MTYDSESVLKEYNLPPEERELLPVKVNNALKTMAMEVAALRNARGLRPFLEVATDRDKG